MAAQATTLIARARVLPFSYGRSNITLIACFSVRSQRSNPGHQDRSHPYLESDREFIFNL